MALGTAARSLPSNPPAPGFLAWVETLVQEHRAKLLGYARRRGLDAEEALDAVQDTFIAFLGLPEARAIAHVAEDSLKLLTVMLRHNVQNRRRKRSRHQRAHLRLAVEPTPDATPSDELVRQAEELVHVEGCIQRMAKLQKLVVMLSLLEERPREDVAALLGISAVHVRVLLHRAREHIRSCPYDAGDAGEDAV